MLVVQTAAIAVVTGIAACGFATLVCMVMLHVSFSIRATARKMIVQILRAAPPVMLMLPDGAAIFAVGMRGQLAATITMSMLTAILADRTVHIRMVVLGAIHVSAYFLQLHTQDLDPIMGMIAVLLVVLIALDRMLYFFLLADQLEPIASGFGLALAFCGEGVHGQHGDDHHQCHEHGEYSLLECCHFSFLL